MLIAIVRQPDGSILHTEGTKWKNTSNVDAVVELPALPPRDNPAFKPNVPAGPSNPLCLAPSYYVLRDGVLATAERAARGPAPLLIIPPGGEVVLPNDCNRGIVIEDCSCGKINSTCEQVEDEHTHRKVVVQGFAPRLRRVRDDGSLVPSTLHPALLEPPPAASTPEGLHERVMRRVAAMKGAT